MASSKKIENLSPDEDVKKIAQDSLNSAIRQSNRIRTFSDLGISTLKNLPATIGMVQSFMRTVNWKAAQEEVLNGLNHTVVIVGQPNTGKSTLFNKIKGENLSPVSSQAGTTLSLVRTDFGPFTLIDTPGIESSGYLSDEVRSGLDQASVIVFLIDASKGLQSIDRELYESIKKLKKPIIVAVNKIDVLKGGENGDQLATKAAVMLGVVGVIPISGKTGENIAEELIPTMIEASPEAALVIGHELPAYRRSAAQRIIRNATFLSLAAGIEPIPLIDIPILLGVQIRLVLRVAALYGEPIDSNNFMLHARALISTMAGGLGFRFLAEQAAKVVPFGGDFVAGAIAGAATWSMGQVALEYYDSGKQISPRTLHRLYTGFYRRFRRQNTPEELRQYQLEGKDLPLLIEEPKEEQLEEKINGK
ncbi:MAG: GTP-binding protein [Chloroflexi bacterium]|nr:MAG: GTP-binding protein [Chloroflexota bacterium]